MKLVTKSASGLPGQSFRLRNNLMQLFETSNFWKKTLKQILKTEFSEICPKMTGKAKSQNCRHGLPAHSQSFWGQRKHFLFSEG